MEGAQEFNAKTFASGIFENNNGVFEFHPFQNIAQLSPVFGIVVSDFNTDGKADLFLAGNYYNREIETTRSDAGIGNLLLGTGGLNFEYVHPSKAGVVASQDVRAVILLKRKSDSIIAIAHNNADMQFFQLEKSGEVN
jgi:hypothetical protein